MPKATDTCNDIIDLIFNGITFNGFAENDSTSPNTDLYLSLHTADPGVGGLQTTNETAYTNYVRVAVSRVAYAGWDAAVGGVTQNAALIQFAQCGVTGATITHVAVGRDSAGGGRVLYAGALTSSLAVANLIQPQFAIGALEVTES
jgi:hypothetical protein